jgi:hypothetical protein
MMNPIEKEIEKLTSESSKSQDEADRLSSLWAEYPDLKRQVGRWHKVVYYSQTVNAEAQRFDIRHNCGCCNDSPLEIWPYLETKYGNVYSDPPCFRVGERHWIAGDRPYDGWEDKMHEANIPENVIGAVQIHFEQGREERRRAAEDEDE